MALGFDGFLQTSDLANNLAIFWDVKAFEFKVRIWSNQVREGNLLNFPKVFKTFYINLVITFWELVDYRLVTGVSEAQNWPVKSRTIGKGELRDLRSMKEKYLKARGNWLVRGIKRPKENEREVSEGERALIARVLIWLDEGGGGDDRAMELLW